MRWMRAAAGALILAAGCVEPAPVEVDGREIRTLIGEIRSDGTRAEAARKWLLELAARSREARQLVFREADRQRRTASLREEECRRGELELLSRGRALSIADQERASALAAERARSGRARGAMEALIGALP